MKANVVGYVPKLLYKIYLYLQNKFDPKPPITEEEKYCLEITKKLITKENSILTLAPLSQKRFIKNDELQMFIMIENRVINIINHIYSYTLVIEDVDAYQEVINQFDDKLDSIRISLETEFRTNVQSSLKNILGSIG
jgi:hypothetical protein